MCHFFSLFSLEVQNLRYRTLRCTLVTQHPVEMSYTPTGQCNLIPNLIPARGKLGKMIAVTMHVAAREVARMRAVKGLRKQAPSTAGDIGMVPACHWLSCESQDRESVRRASSAGLRRQTRSRSGCR